MFMLLCFCIFFRSETPVLYHIIPEKRNDRIGNAMMASTHVYDLASMGAAQNPVPIRR